MLLSYLLGEWRFAIPEKDALLLANFCRMTKVSQFSPERCQKNGEFFFSVYSFSARKILHFCAEKNIPLRKISEKGLPLFLSDIGKRKGFVVGGILALSILFLSPLFLFGIEISGNELVTHEEIEEALSLAGLEKGCFLPSVDVDAVSNALRRADSRLSYVSINLRGNVAKIQVREAEVVPESVPLLPANLVAKSDGTVTLPLVFEGKCLVEEGQVVRKGQLLASGFFETENNGTRVTRASGEVLARTVREYEVFVPFTYRVRTETGNVGREISLLFFSSAQKVFKMTGNNTEEYDIIQNIKWWTMPSGRKMPIGIHETKRVYYSVTERKRDAAEALRVAKAELAEKIAAESDSFTLLRKETEFMAEEDGVRLRCTVICEENIAVTAEFSPVA